MACTRNKNALRFFGVLFIFLFPFLVSAQTIPSGEKVYSYDTIDVAYKVQPDTTVQVEETQTFNFTSGEFHTGWREIPKNKIDGISDVHVMDVDLGNVYTYSSRRLDKTDKNSWGKYTVFNQEGKTIIEWYYDGSNGLRTWKLDYVLHGALGFFSDADELYVNVFDSYSVPVKNVHASVSLPTGAVAIQNAAFREDASNQISSYVENGIYNFRASSIQPNEAFTVKVSWPRGFINRTSYILSFIQFYYGVVSFVILLLGTMVFSVIYLLSKKRKETEGKGTIVPEYEPPKNFRPMVAEVITKGYVGNKGLSATIIDLAVRGYLVIEEDPAKGIFAQFSSKNKTTGKTKFGNVYFKAMLIALVSVIAAISGNPGMGIIIFCIGIFILFISKFKRVDYILKKKKDFSSDTTLEDFEKEYLLILFGSEDSFSTRELRSFRSKSAQREMYLAMQKLKKDIVAEVEGDTRAYERPRSRSNTYLGVACVLLFFSFYLLSTQIGFLIVGLYLCIATVVWMLKFRPILSKDGRILREDWLGFKTYLETAEAQRLENLTPETFEKFLPYAMVFGLEKKWANAFRTIDVPEPSWYHGAYIGSVAGTSGVSSFSPSSFASSFSSSFSSAFSSSGAGGGGSAGGGGGGGGGGAS